MTQLDYRNINGVQLGSETLADGADITSAIERSIRALPAIHAIGIEGFGIVTVHPDGTYGRFGWIDPGISGGPEFQYGGRDALRWTLAQRGVQTNYSR